MEGRTKKGNLRYLEELRKLARKNRQVATRPEDLMWNEVRDRKVGYKFSRQKPIGKFIIDFYCSELLLAVELDGEYHNWRKSYDETRDKYLGWRRIVVIRYKNKEIIDNLPKVIRDLTGKIKAREKELVKYKRGEGVSLK